MYKRHLNDSVLSENYINKYRMADAHIRTAAEELQAEQIQRQENGEKPGENVKEAAMQQGPPQSEDCRGGGQGKNEQFSVREGVEFTVTQPGKAV